MEAGLEELCMGVLDAMASKRDELGHRGTAGVLFVEKDAVGLLRAGKKVNVLFEPVFGVNLISRASRDDPKVFYNFPNTASGKLWQMVRTGKASGPEGAIAGEPTYLGGITVEWGEFYVFITFSGAPEEVDVQISEAGAKALPTWEEWQEQFD